MLIDENDPSYFLFKSFIEKEIEYSKDPKVNKSSYFIINENSVTVADQNATRINAEWLRFSLLDKTIKLSFSAKFPASIKVVALGRRDHYPYSIPVVDLFYNLQTNIKKDVKVKKL